MTRTEARSVPKRRERVGAIMYSVSQNAGYPFHTAALKKPKIRPKGLGIGHRAVYIRRASMCTLRQRLVIFSSGLS
jgi:hypothetical protein